jgi:methionyl aminopeptidase
MADVVEEKVNGVANGEAAAKKNKNKEEVHANGVEEKADDDDATAATAAGEEKAKKKRNRPKKKPAAATAGEEEKHPKVSSGKKQQTDPPTLPVSELFPDGNFPEGQIMEYADLSADGRSSKDRYTSEEARAVDRAQLDMYKEVRQAAEAHRQTRRYIQKFAKPGE